MKSSPRNLAKQMAKLNHKSMNLQGSRGGMPDITPEELVKEVYDEAIAKEYFRGQNVGSYLRKTVDSLIRNGTDCINDPKRWRSAERELTFCATRLSNLVPQNWPTPAEAR